MRVEAAHGVEARLEPMRPSRGARGEVGRVLKRCPRHPFLALERLCSLDRAKRPGGVTTRPKGPPTWRGASRFATACPDRGDNPKEEQMTSEKRGTIAPGTIESYPGSALARHRRFPAHDRPALCRSRQIDSRARRGHEDRPVQFCSRRRRTPATTIRRPTRSITIGTLATVLQLLKLPDGTVKVLVEGVSARQGAALYAHRRFL